MAATGSSGRPNDDVLCPLCSYTNSPQSVEAHISAKTDEQHRGEVGRQYRDQLRSPKPTSNEGHDEVAHEVAEEHVTNDVARDDSGEGDGTSSTCSDTTEVADEHVTGDVAESDVSDTSSDGTRTGVPTVVFVVLVLTLVLAVVWLTYPRRTERERDERSQHYARPPSV